jgi:hypothetical protein
MLGCTAADRVIVLQLENASPESVARVDYTPPQMIDPPRVDIYLRTTVSRSEGTRIACDILLPITRPAVMNRDMEVFVWTSTHDLLVASDAPCAQ